MSLQNIYTLCEKIDLTDNEITEKNLEEIKSLLHQIYPDIVLVLSTRIPEKFDKKIRVFYKFKNSDLILFTEYNCQGCRECKK